MRLVLFRVIREFVDRLYATQKMIHELHEIHEGAEFDSLSDGTHPRHYQHQTDPSTDPAHYSISKHNRGVEDDKD